MIQLVVLPSTQLTSYLANGGGTRLPDGSVPVVALVRRVQPDDPRWRATPGMARDLALVNADIVERGGEPVRLTDCLRDPGRQADARHGYDAWCSAGKPSPKDAKWIGGMKTAYACKPGESDHGWGAAIDIDVGALLPAAGMVRGSNAALAVFWEIAQAHGFRPVISEPRSAMSEAWHFSHIGPLQVVKDLFIANGMRGDASPNTARAGHVLANTLPKGQTIFGDINVAYLQALCALSGAFPGPIDGVWGPRTRTALSVLGIPSSAKTFPASLIPAANHLELGKAAMEAA